MKDMIHQKTGDKFQCRSAEKSKQKKIEEMPLMSMSEEDQKAGSHTIQGNPGSMAKSSIL